MPAPLCPYGSTLRPDSPLYAWVSYLNTRDWLGIKWPIFSWIASGFTATLTGLTTFCATEPAQPVYPGDATLRDAATNPAAFEEILRYIREGTIWWAWSQYCVCSGGGSGVCATIAVDWTTYTNVGDPGSNRNAGLIVSVGAAATTLYGAEVFVYGTPSISRLIIWDSTTTTILAQKNTTSPTTGRQRVFLDTPIVFAPGAAFTVAFSWTGTQQYLHWGTNAAPPGSDGVTYSAYVENSDYSVCPTAARTYKALLMPITCSTGTPDDYTYDPEPPPPPDTDLPPYPTPIGDDCAAELCDLVRQLQIQLAGVRSQVDLIQRQNVPFGYIVSTVHSGLSGSGSFSVAGKLGLLIQTATVPAFWGVSSENPPRYIPSPLAVTVGDAAGDQDHHFCHLVEELWFPTNMGAMTTVSYKFKPGCSGAITELRREF